MVFGLSRVDGGVVLGAKILGDEIRIPDTADLNTYKTSGYYARASSNLSNITNIPSGVSNGFKLLVFNPYGGSQYGTQILVVNNKIYIRNHLDENNWSSWVEIATGIPSFYKNYTTLADLWSGLAYATTEMSDCNNAPLGIGLVTSNTQNIPASATMIVLTLGNSSGHKAQLCFRATGYLFYRGYAGGVWSAWKEISMK